ncbi:MAG TPA: sugar phosphate nucleotidyltransferase [Myxococcales bacterium]|nr:sugar phosphate nucleotidyltransferase [Myxococcales bacterium]
MVLCAGFGTRLRPLTDRVPKPLVPLCGVPLLRYNLALLKNAGVGDVVINTHHLGAEMEKGARAIALELSLGLQISREEKQILGTGGGVKRAQAMLGGETFFLLNGDMIFDVDLAAALEAHRAAGAAATMVLAPYPRGASYGAVEVDAALNVRRIAGRGAAPEPSLVKTHFTGVHVIGPELLARLPPEGESDINRTAYVRAIHDGVKVLGFMQAGYWGDLGAPRSLLRAHLDVLLGKVPLRRFLPHADPFAGCEERERGVFVHPAAQVEAQLQAPALVHAGAKVAAGARMGPGVMVGANARIDAGAHLERAVVWENTHVAGGERVVDQLAAPGVRLDA